MVQGLNPLEMILEPLFGTLSLALDSRTEFVGDDWPCFGFWV
jgi:hypothetical protein